MEASLTEILPKDSTGESIIEIVPLDDAVPIAVFKGRRLTYKDGAVLAPYDSRPDFLTGYELPPSQFYLDAVAAVDRKSTGGAKVGELTQSMKGYLREY